jgi:hypothetical protein
MSRHVTSCQSWIRLLWSFCSQKTTLSVFTYRVANSIFCSDLVSASCGNLFDHCHSHSRLSNPLELEKFANPATNLWLDPNAVRLWHRVLGNIPGVHNQTKPRSISRLGIHLICSRDFPRTDHFSNLINQEHSLFVSMWLRDLNISESQMYRILWQICIIIVHQPEVMPFGDDWTMIPVMTGIMSQSQ